MGKRIILKDLSRAQLIEQLKLCWEHFRRCRSALDGNKDVQPVELIGCDELGDCDDLELFYSCVKKGGAFDGEE